MGRKLIDRTGEKRIMNCGENAIIIACRSAKDLDVEFDCGYISKGVTYQSFLRGNVKPQTHQVGDTRTMSSGLKATIIAYRKYTDIDIQFENGQIVKNSHCSPFINGNIKCPLIYEFVDDYVKVIIISFTKTHVFYIDPEDYDIVKNIIWSVNNKNYVVKTNPHELLHRFIMNAKCGEIVDHIDGNTFDCRKSNLRICTKAENNRNRNKAHINKSGYIGVSWHKQHQKWHSQIKHNKKVIHIGYFDCPKKAAEAYNQAALKYHGNFARINKIDNL